MDRYDIPFVISDIRTKMPHHTKINSIIPYDRFELPKNHQDASNRIDNKFLNNNLSNIEEADHLELLPKTVKDYFLNQQFKYHGKSDVLNHDGFLKTPKEFHKMSLLDVGFVGTISKSIGAELESSDGSTGTTGAGVSFLMTERLPTAVVGSEYDRIAIQTVTAAGNINMGIYDDTSDVPDNLGTETGAFALSVDYNWHSLTPYNIVTAQSWTAVIQNNVSAQWKYQTLTSGDVKYKTGESYPTLTDPFPASPTSGAFVLQTKIGHT